MPDTGSVVIGIGNAARGDDGAGPAAARLVAARAPDGARVLERDGEPARLIDAWEGAGTAILIDAAFTGAPAGTVHRFDASAAPLPTRGSAAGASTHGLGVSEAIELARAVRRLPGRVVVYGVELGCLEHGEPLSPAVLRGVEVAADRVIAELGGSRGAPIPCDP